MQRVQKLEQEIESLSAEELARFRAWFLEFDWDQWDDQLQRDAASGKLRELAEEALNDHKLGLTKPL